LTSVPHVLILGGGFGGLTAANKIRNNLSSSQVKITVIDKKDWFMVGFAKLWIIRGTRTFENSIGSLNQLVKKEINFLKEEILQIDLQNKNIKTPCGESCARRSTAASSTKVIRGEAGG
jgi:sulfide:quinone oxidoreductase